MTTNQSLLLASSSFCNFPSPKTLSPTRIHSPSQSKTLNLGISSLRPTLLRICNSKPLFSLIITTRIHRHYLHHLCHSSINDDNSSEDPVSLEEAFELDYKNNEDGSQWISSVLLFALWAGLMYYVFQLTPNQTPSRDFYFLQKLLMLKGDDGFRMNEVLVSLWNMMGLWPLIYSMLLLPSGRSSRSKIPVWPFLVMSFFGGAYALLPYFVLWRPPPPPIEEAEIGKWPLNFLESRITAGALFVAGLGLITYAALANGDVWAEFYQYFRESKFIHVTSLDFSLLSALCPFWVYNDMTIRRWFDKGSWLLPITLIPLLGPGLYLILRPPLPATTDSIPLGTVKED